MAGGPLGSDEATNSRQRADERAWADESSRQDALSPEVARQVLHELRVHQIELETQNEELRRIQRELEASRARYFDLYDLAPVGYFTISKQGLVLEANLTVARLLGVTRSALVEHSFTERILPADQDVYYRHKRQLFATGEPQVCEVRLLRPDAAPFWARLEATTAQDGENAQVVCRVVVSDISERKQAEAALRASEARHRILFERSQDALMTLVPPAWRYTSGNSTTVAMFGARDEADFLSRDPMQYSPEHQPDGSASVDKARAMIETAMREGSHFCEWTYRRLSGQCFPATVLVTRVEIDGQAMLQATIRDETEKRALQARVAQADRLASMGMLAAGVAHEINNPLAYVLFNVESLAHDLPKLGSVARRCSAALREQVGDAAFAEMVGPGAEILRPVMLDDVADRAREALDGAHRIRNISRGLSAFSRVESVERSPVDLTDAIEHAATMAQNEIKYRARLVKDYGQVPPIRASEGKLSQVFLNLIINAAHAIDEGDAEHNSIRIRTWSESHDVFAEVTDTGHGIPAANLERIFEPFFTTKKAGEGSGLGLAICRNILTGFGGDIRVESEVGKGARFVVRLPVPDLAPQQRNEAVAETPSAPVVRGRILVVDDEAQIRKMMQRLLGRVHEVVTAASGEEGRAILEQDGSFDLILCDLMMPQMSGMDLHRWLATQNPILAGQIVFVTGGAFTPRASEYLARVGNLRIEKPFDIPHFKRLVSELIVAVKSRR